MFVFRHARIAALTALVSFPAAISAAGDCQCRANGQAFSQGETTCLLLPDGPRLARCEMVLNNTSWTLLDRACLAVSKRLERRSSVKVAHIGARSSGH